MAKAVCVSYGFFIGSVGLLLLFSGIRVWYVIIIIVGLALLMWGLTRKPKPTGESSCGAVSCCHYLGETGEVRLRRGNSKQSS